MTIDKSTALPSWVKLGCWVWSGCGGCVEYHKIESIDFDSKTVICTTPGWIDRYKCTFDDIMNNFIGAAYVAPWSMHEAIGKIVIRDITAANEAYIATVVAVNTDGTCYLGDGTVLKLKDLTQEYFHQRGGAPCGVLHQVSHTQL